MLYRQRMFRTWCSPRYGAFKNYVIHYGGGTGFYRKFGSVWLVWLGLAFELEYAYVLYMDILYLLLVRIYA